MNQLCNPHIFVPYFKMFRYAFKCGKCDLNDFVKVCTVVQQFLKE